MPKTRKNTGADKPPRTLDFGYDPTECATYYELAFVRNDAVLTLVREGRREEKARISLYRWSKVAQLARATLNITLIKYGYPPGRWILSRPTRLGRLYGKELLTLMWAVEEPQPEEQIERAGQCWAALHPEERWYLCTMADSVSNQPGFGPSRGWRMAIKYGLGE